MKARLILTALATGLYLILPTAFAGFVSGTAGHADFSASVTAGNMILVDFEGLPGGSDLPPNGVIPSIPAGIAFRSVTGATGIPINHEAIAAALRAGSIVGTPFTGSSDDGRVDYEIVFQTPQQAVGASRFFNDVATQFENAAGDVLLRYNNTANLDFVGYYGDLSDADTWVTRVLMTGDGPYVSPFVQHQSGYTDDLFFGTFIPEPSTFVLGLVGVASLLAVRRVREKYRV